MVMIADFEAIYLRTPPGASYVTETRSLRTTVSTKADIPSPIDMAPVMKTANLTCGWDLPVCESRFHDRINTGTVLHPLDSLILEFALGESTLRACVTRQRLSTCAAPCGDRSVGMTRRSSSCWRPPATRS